MAFPPARIIQLWHGIIKAYRAARNPCGMGRRRGYGRGAGSERRCASRGETEAGSAGRWGEGVDGQGVGALVLGVAEGGQGAGDDLLGAAADRGGPRGDPQAEGDGAGRGAAEAAG